MYELVTAFATADRSSWDEDVARAREWYSANGATDVYLAELISGAHAGIVAWVARFATVDDYASFAQSALALLVPDPGNEYADLRARSTLVARSLRRVATEAGERGPCMSVTEFTSEKPIPDDEGKHSLGLLVANGCTGSSTSVVIEGESIGRYYSASSSDSFEGIEAAFGAVAADERHMATFQDCGLKRTNRWLFTTS